MALSVQGFVDVTAVAAALLALWFVVRFPGAGPKTPLTAAANLVVAFVVGSLEVGPALAFLGSLPIAEHLVLAVLLGALPPLVYLFCAFGWFVRSAQRQLGAYR